MTTKVLVIAECDANKLKDSTLNTITAANKIDKKIDLLLITSDLSKFADKEFITKLTGIDKVIIYEDKNNNIDIAENITNISLAIIEQYNYTHILTPSTTFGKNFLPRLAAKLDVAQATDVIEIISNDTIKRPIYAGNAIATVKMTDKTKLMTIRPTAFEAAKETNNVSEIINQNLHIKTFDKTSFVEFNSSSNSNSKTELTSAQVVISGGRGVGSKESFNLLEKLADKFKNSAIGASRAAVDSEFIENDHQIGQTGKIVAPKLYIAVGISGAIQHIAGIKDSQTIIAINKDQNSPIFEISDFGLVSDYKESVEKLIELL